MMEAIIFATFGICLTCLFMMWLSLQIRYRITPRCFQVMIFGFRVREIPLDEIEYVSKRRPSWWSETWYNCTKPSHRLLVIHRTRGLRRQFAISPRNRYVFRADLERAIQGRKNPKPDTERLSIVSD